MENIGPGRHPILWVEQQPGRDAYRGQSGVTAHVINLRGASPNPPTLALDQALNGAGRGISSTSHMQEVCRRIFFAGIELVHNAISGIGVKMIARADPLAFRRRSEIEDAHLLPLSVHEITQFRATSSDALRRTAIPPDESPHSIHPFRS